jgi:DNA-binding response OmpR family regulator
VDLIELTLNHGLFIVRAASSLAEADTILSEWQPHLAVVDMDLDDSSDLLERVGASNTLTQSVTPVLGLTRRGDLQTKLRAFELGVDDILTVPFSPEELLARPDQATRRVTRRIRSLSGARAAAAVQATMTKTRGEWQSARGPLARSDEGSCLQHGQPDPRWPPKP